MGAHRETASEGRMSELLPYFGVAVAAASFGYSIWISVSNKHGKKIERIQSAIAVVETQLAGAQQQLELRIDRVEDRVTRIESDLRHLPDKGTTHRLELAISELRGEVARITESIKPISAMTARVQELIIEKVAGQ